MIPAGWIPPEFRENVYAPLSEQEIQDGMSMMKISDKKSLREVTREEFLEAIGDHKIIGVKDTRTGEINWTQLDTI